jgi:hypothetical protein
MKLNPRAWLLLACTAMVQVAPAATMVLYTNESAFTAASSAVLLDDFEAFATKDTALASIISQGVTYTAYAGFPTPNVWVASPGYSNFGPAVPQPTTTSILTANGDEDFIGGSFATAAYALGFDVYLNGLGAASVEFFSGVTSLGTINFAPAANGVEFAGITSTTAITSFHFVSTLGGQINTGIDNVRVAASATSVPDTGSLLMYAAIPGLILVQRLTRRRTR